MTQRRFDLAEKELGLALAGEPNNPLAHALMATCLAEREEFRVRVEKSGLSISAFITKSIFKTDPPRQSRRPAVEAELLAQLVAEAAKIREELCSIELASGDDSETAKTVEAAYQELAEIRAACFKAFGRQP